MSNFLLRRVETALTHALESSLGANLKPLPGNEKDAEAVGVLMELRKVLGIKNEASPQHAAGSPKPPDSSPSR